MASTWPHPKLANMDNRKSSNDCIPVNGRHYHHPVTLVSMETSAFFEIRFDELRNMARPAT